MKAPDKIYIQPNAHDGWFEGNKPNDNFVEYIRKDALLEWLEGTLDMVSKTEKCVPDPSGSFQVGIGVLGTVIEKVKSM